MNVSITVLSVLKYPCRDILTFSVKYFRKIFRIYCILFMDIFLVILYYIVHYITLPLKLEFFRFSIKYFGI